MKTKVYSIVLFFVFLLGSCRDLTEVNEDPNAITRVESYLLLSTVLSKTAMLYHADNFSGLKVTGGVQYIQKDINGGSDCKYEWSASGWTGYYDILRNNQRMYSDARARDNNFYQGVALVMKAFLFGYITDLWGDCPYSEALKGNNKVYYPKFDEQKTVLENIFLVLDSANNVLSQTMPVMTDSEKSYDLAFGGNALKWRKLANSLALRYYMRLSEKDQAWAKSGFEKIMSDPQLYPIMESNDDLCGISYPGVNSWDSWPGGPLVWRDGSEFNKRKPCKTLVDALKELKDPRLELWVAPVQIQLVVENPPYTYTDEDVVVGNKRYIHDNASILIGKYYDTTKYVGIVPNIEDEYFFNLTETQRDGTNPSASYLTPMYQQNTNSLVKANLMTFTEVCFLKSEAAFRGWNTGGGSAESFYTTGVKASLDYYKVGTNYSSYIAQPRAAYNNTLARIIEQKWISQFLLPESWFDWRRTGYPYLPVNPVGTVNPAVPVRFIYPSEESRNNSANYNEATARLERTEYTTTNSNDNHYSKQWILQNTGKPW